MKFFTLLVLDQEWRKKYGAWKFRCGWREKARSVEFMINLPTYLDVKTDPYPHIIFYEYWTKLTIRLMSDARSSWGTSRSQKQALVWLRFIITETETRQDPCREKAKANKRQASQWRKPIFGLSTIDVRSTAQCLLLPVSLREPCPHSSSSRTHSPRDVKDLHHMWHNVTQK